MILFALLAFFGGMLTIASPCILPVIPFVFARADRPFRTSGLPLLLGMVASFALVSTIASVGGGWVVQANSYGRYAALALLAFFAITMLSPALAERFTRPLVRLGGELSKQGSSRSNFWQSLVLGVATGLLWAPCAGPILGAILSGAALGGARVSSTFLLVAYGLGAAASLALVLLGGQKVLDRMKRSLGVEEQIRKGLGVAILVGVTVVAFGLDRGLLTKLSEGSTSGLEQSLLERLHPQPTMAATIGGGQKAVLDNEGVIPALPAAANWVNSPPLTKANLRGKVVLIDFWTYSCINCLRTLPNVKALYATYAKDGFVVIGVHTPEFAFERDRGNVETALKQLGITYPVAQDNDYAVWNAFHNEYWPAHYLVDVNGVIRYHHFGEGNERETETAIRALLKERGAKLGALATPEVAKGALAAEDNADDQSPETYLGSSRAERFLGTVTVAQRAAVEKKLTTNEWALAGAWDQSAEHATLRKPGGSVSFRFHARDAHLVLGPGSSSTPVHFKVFLDGQAVGAAHGSDVDAAGNGMVSAQRLYQLVRQQGVIRDHVLRIEFRDPGVQGFAFTFG